MSKTTPEEAKAIADKHGVCLHPFQVHRFERLAALIDEVRGVDAEPVALWAERDATGKFKQNTCLDHEPHFGNFEPLYTHPAPSQPAAPVELPVVAWKWEVLPGTEHSRRKGEPEGVYLQDPRSFGIPMDHPSYRWTELVKLSDAQAAIAAGRKAS